MPKTSPALNAVLRGKLCSGCGLCAGVAEGAVALELAPPGFLRPRQTAPLTARQESIIAGSCPGLTVARWDREPEVEIDPAWGPYRRLLTGHATDDAVRFVGSSGGMLTALCQFALGNGLVDAVVTVLAGDGDTPLANPVQVIDDPAALLAAAGSRYGPSSPLATVARLLDDGRRFLFVGKPCDVSALRQLGRFDARVAERFPFALSFFCGGVPSLTGSERVIEAMGLAPADVGAFRYRGNGWPGKARAETRDGRSAEMDYETCWGGYLSKHVQFRCKICPDAVGGAADIACADAWFGGETGYPQFEDRDGRSLVMVRTEAGASLLDAALAQGVVECERTGIADIDLMQPSQKRRKSLVAARTAALAATLKPRPRFRGVAVRKAARGAPVRDQLRNFLGTTWRIVKGRQ
ncbi:MAG: Coenzyme F420 hydrogenase/dehydrogenase, beta subunit C-terminal domain [Qipengyuania sp.]|jgi:coenzyme F420 hydrogenase subunit beta|nr:Coenzyme F420 hydrogenase/dehydrogenase, beta subunit C-terminal domain [Qipengyuania sp.]